MSNQGLGGIVRNSKPPAGGGGMPAPPFAATSADNGLSVDGVSGRIVLGDDGSGTAALLSNRSIALAGSFIDLNDNTGGFDTRNIIQSSGMTVVDAAGFNYIDLFLGPAGAAAELIISGQGAASGLPKLSIIPINPIDGAVVFQNENGILQLTDQTNAGGISFFSPSNSGTGRAAVYIGGALQSSFPGGGNTGLINEGRIEIRGGDIMIYADVAATQEVSRITSDAFLFDAQYGGGAGFVTWRNGADVFLQFDLVGKELFIGEPVTLNPQPGNASIYVQNGVDVNNGQIWLSTNQTSIGSSIILSSRQVSIDTAGGFLIDGLIDYDGSTGPFKTLVLSGGGFNEAVLVVGVTQSIVAGANTLNFEGGILTSVT